MQAAPLVYPGHERALAVPATQGLTQLQAPLAKLHVPGARKLGFGAIFADGFKLVNFGVFTVVVVGVFTVVVVGVFTVVVVGVFTVVVVVVFTVVVVVGATEVGAVRTTEVGVATVVGVSTLVGEEWAADLASVVDWWIVVKWATRPEDARVDDFRL